MRIDLPYGNKTVRIQVPDRATVTSLQEKPGIMNIRAEIRRAMVQPEASVLVIPYAVNCVPIIDA